MAKRRAEEPADPQPAEAPAPEGYTVLARRYRPQQFGELVGQEAVAQALSNAVQTHRVAHAYLFTGARGVGKTSTARILAKALNCEKGPTTTPCDQCDMCRAVASGEDVDVLEIDGASNRGIDEVREIRQNVQYRPSRGRYKIYIIDEVHMLTTAAFNALLKTLEEPPPHVKFIFATTEIQKIPVTILSRCQRFDFGGISLPRIVDRLEAIAKAEGTEAEREALELVARRAGGSMRDAQSLLDQLLAFNNKLTVSTVHALLGTANEDRVASLAQSVLQHDARQALEQLAAAVEQGQQLGELLDQLIEYWRDLMVVRSAGLEGQDLSVTGERRSQLAKFAQGLNLDTVLAGLDVLVAAKTKLRFSSHARVLVEAALVRLSQLEELVPLTQLTRLLEQGGGKAIEAPKRAAPTAPAEKKNLNQVSVPAEAGLSLCSENIDAIWTKVLGEVGFATAGELKKLSSLAISEPNTLAVRFSQRYNVPGGVLDASRLARVEEALRKTTGQVCKVQVEYVRDETASSPVAATATAQMVQQARQQRSELMQLPLVKKALEVLSAQLIKADEGFGVPVGVVAVAGVPEEE